MAKTFEEDEKKRSNRACSRVEMPKRKPGALKGRIRISKDFDALLPNNVLDQLEGK